MNNTLTRTQVYLDNTNLTIAKQIAKSNKTTISQILRDSLSEFIQKQQNQKQKPKLRTVTLKDQTIRNYSQQIDTIYDQ